MSADRFDNDFIRMKHDHNITENKLFSHANGLLTSQNLPSGAIPNGPRGMPSPSIPPPIPTRPRAWPGGGPGIPYTPMNNYTYGAQYNPSAFSNPYSFGGYNGYNRMNQNLNPNSFMQAAEDSSRRAFQSIESVVNAFGSVSMMLDSTYQAVYSSFRAVIGVADNFSRLKNQLVGVFTSLSLFRMLHYVYRRLLQITGIRPFESVTDAWQEAKEAAHVDLTQRLANENAKCNWPILVYMGIIFGAPWLIWKLVSKFVPNNKSMEWVTGEGKHFVARVMYDFTSPKDDEISVQANQLVRVAPRELQPMVKDWLLASVNGETTGLIPATYVKILGQSRGTKNTPKSPLVNARVDSQLEDGRRDRGDSDEDGRFADGDAEPHSS